MGSKAMQHFKKKPFKERMKDTLYLLKNSFTVIGKDSDIITATWRMIAMTAFLLVLFFFALYTFFTGWHVGLGVLAIIIWLVLQIYRFFFDVKQKACQSWVVYNTITGKDISYKDAQTHTKKVKWTLRKIALVDFAMSYVKSQQKNQKKGILGFLIMLFLKALEEVWDLLSHYMLPAVVVEQKKITELVSQLKSLRKNVPATLVGVFGIDFVGNVVSRLLNPIGSVIFLLSVGLGYLTAGSLSGFSWTAYGYTISWLPPFITLFILLLIGGGVKKFVESIKVIYFTIFYTAIQYPAKIDKSMKAELTHYLKFEQMGSKKKRTH